MRRRAGDLVLLVSRSLSVMVTPKGQLGKLKGPRITPPANHGPSSCLSAAAIGCSPGLSECGEAQSLTPHDKEDDWTFDHCAFNAKAVSNQHPQSSVVRPLLLLPTPLPLVLLWRPHNHDHDPPLPPSRAVPCAIGALKCKEPLAESKQFIDHANPALPLPCPVMTYHLSCPALLPQPVPMKPERHATCHAPWKTMRLGQRRFD
ncbi:hypothetical protein IWX90DRAFT_279381 [Phyllosticta citrichinensis]|uniref:Uncharacterized protein n=1 Tax=Phyllosticta citrichinensis TaxID=1130410 RepID=A0ABR1XNG2_9PEZI